MLTAKNKEYFRQLLTKILEGLITKTKNNSVSELSEGSEQPPDFSDQASMESDMDYNIHMKERDRNLISKIESALERIEEGTYGICEECGKAISLKRLKARPVTTRCIACKKKQEVQEKLRGQ